MSWGWQLLQRTSSARSSAQLLVYERCALLVRFLSASQTVSWQGSGMQTVPSYEPYDGPILWFGEASIRHEVLT